MEYRAWIEVPDLPFEDEDRWESLSAHLESRFARFGPILSWEGKSVLVVMSTESNDRSSAARTLFDAVADSLRSAGLVDLYPASVVIEVVEEQLTPA